MIKYYYSEIVLYVRLGLPKDFTIGKEAAALAR